MNELLYNQSEHSRCTQHRLSTGTLLLHKELRDADRNAVDEQNIVGRTGVGRKLAHRDAQAGAQVDIAHALHQPTGGDEPAIDADSGLVFGCGHACGLWGWAGRRNSGPSTTRQSGGSCRVAHRWPSPRIARGSPTRPKALGHLCRRTPGWHVVWTFQVFAQVAAIIAGLLGAVCGISVITYRSVKRIDNNPKLAPSADVTQQIAQLQQSVDAIAVEVERIAEAQRFMARLESERDARQALPLQS